MRATLYKNHSDERYVSKDLSSIGTYNNLVFKDDEDLVTPTFKVTDSSFSEECNYLYVQDLGRYYYIRSRRFSRQCLFLECQVDVLMSFSNDIHNMTGIISRNERLYNLYLNDEKMEIYNYPYFQTLNMKCVSGNGFNMKINNICLALVGSVDGGE